MSEEDNNNNSDSDDDGKRKRKAAKPRVRDNRRRKPPRKGSDCIWWFLRDERYSIIEYLVGLYTWGQDDMWNYFRALFKTAVWLRVIAPTGYYEYHRLIAKSIVVRYMRTVSVIPPRGVIKGTFACPFAVRYNEAFRSLVQQFKERKNLKIEQVAFYNEQAHPWQLALLAIIAPLQIRKLVLVDTSMNTWDGHRRALKLLRAAVPRLGQSQVEELLVMHAGYDIRCSVAPGYWWWRLKFPFLRRFDAGKFAYLVHSDGRREALNLHFLHNHRRESRRVKTLMRQLYSVVDRVREVEEEEGATNDGPLHEMLRETGSYLPIPGRMGDRPRRAGRTWAKIVTNYNKEVTNKRAVYGNQTEESIVNLAVEQSLRDAAHRFGIGMH